MRWEESVREALCFGWIDGLRKSIDEESYKIRFTPRRSDSHWSDKNIRMVEELIEELAPSYTKTSTHWVMSAKREDTRQRRELPK